MGTVAQYIYINIEETAFWVSHNVLQVKCYCLLTGPVCKIVEKVSFHTHQIPMLLVARLTFKPKYVRLINQLSYKLDL